MHVDDIDFSAWSTPESWRCTCVLKEIHLHSLQLSHGMLVLEWSFPEQLGVSKIWFFGERYEVEISHSDALLHHRSPFWKRLQNEQDERSCRGSFRRILQTKRFDIPFFGPESQNFARKSFFVIIKVANKSYSRSDSSWGIRHNSKKSREIPIWVEGEQSLIKNPGRHWSLHNHDQHA